MSTSVGTLGNIAIVIDLEGKTEVPEWIREFPSAQRREMGGGPTLGSGARQHGPYDSPYTGASSNVGIHRN